MLTLASTTATLAVSSQLILVSGGTVSCPLGTIILSSNSTGENNNVAVANLGNASLESHHLLVQGMLTVTGSMVTVEVAIVEFPTLLLKAEVGR